MRADLPCSMEQAAPFAHIADELVAVAARINAHRGASTSFTASDCPPDSRETASLVPPARQDAAAGSLSQHGWPADGARIVWDAERLQCVWRYVQLYHVQLNGQLPDLKKLAKDLGTYMGADPHAWHGMGMVDTGMGCRYPGSCDRFWHTSVQLPHRY